MGYKVIPVTEHFITNNRSGEWLEPVGIVLHETATPGATDEAEFGYFNGAYRGASAHEFIDYDSDTLMIPHNEVAWHAGYKANHRYIGIEMCNFGNDMAKNNVVWQNTVGRIATLFIENGWKLHFAENDFSSTLVTHRWVTDHLKGTTHVDPDAFLSKFGCTFQDFYNDVEAAITDLTAPAPAPTPAPAPAPAEQKVEVWVQGVNVTSGDIDGVLKEDGRTYVPVRIVANAFNEPVGWDNDCHKILVNGSILETSFIRGDVGYAWARELAEALRAKLTWDGTNMAIVFA